MKRKRRKLFGLVVSMSKLEAEFNHKQKAARLARQSHQQRMQDTLDQLVNDPEGYIQDRQTEALLRNFLAPVGADKEVRP